MNMTDNICRAGKGSTRLSSLPIRLFYTVRWANVPYWQTKYHSSAPQGIMNTSEQLSEDRQRQC